MVPESLTRFLNAMHHKDRDGLEAELANDVSLRSPIVPTPFEGKSAVVAVLMLLLKHIDEYETRDVLTGNGHYSVYFGLTAGEVAIDGMDYVRLNAESRIQDLTVMWRPLPAVVAMQNRLAPDLNIPALQLTERSN